MEKLRVVEVAGLLEHCLLVGDVLQLVVGGEERNAHGCLDGRKLISRDEPRAVAVVPHDVGHQLERIVLVPGSASVEDAPASVSDVLQLLVDELDSVPLGSGNAVFDVDDVVGEDAVGVLARQGAAAAKAQELARPRHALAKVGGDLALRRPLHHKLHPVELLHNRLEVRGVED